MAKVTVVLDPDDYAYVCEIASLNCMTVSQAARAIIQEYIIYDMVGAHDGSD